MKVYIAAPWAARDDIWDIARQVEKAGHEITHKWWTYPDAPEDGSKDTNDYLRGCGDADIKGVKSADAVLLINSMKSEGKAVEQGIAIALNKPIIAVGVRGELSKNVFHHTNHYTWVATVADGIKTLGGLNVESA